MRINMTYRNSIVTSADFSPTIGRDVYAEGPFEGLYRSKLSTDCDTAEFQFQIGTITWMTRDGESRSFTFDGGRITSDEREVWFEIKAHRSYFADPQIADVLDAAERVLAGYNIELEKIDGSTLLDRVRIQCVSEVLRYRNVPYDSVRDVGRAVAVVQAHQGSAPLGAILDVLHASRRQATAMACAMLVRRAIGFRADSPLTSDTPVHIPLRPNRHLTCIES